MGLLPELRDVPLRRIYDGLQRLPAGRRVFSRLVGIAAPYTGTLRAQVVELRKGYARVVLPERRALHNHIASVHAAALANLVELTGNVALAYSMPDDARFIVTRLQVEYVKKARGAIVAECHCTIPETNERQEYDIPVTLADPQGDVVVRGVLRSLVGPRR